MLRAFSKVFFLMSFFLKLTLFKTKNAIHLQIRFIFTKIQNMKICKKCENLREPEQYKFRKFWKVIKNFELPFLSVLKYKTVDKQDLCI